jgi:hypothetical protein
MARWVMGLGFLLGACLLAMGFRSPPGEEVTPSVSLRNAVRAAPARPLAVVDLPELYARPAAPPVPAPPRPDAVDEEPPPSRVVLTDSASWNWPERRTEVQPSPRNEEDAWRREAAQAARAGNASISPSRSLDDVTIASGTVDGRVKRVRPGALEVSDDEGNVYELLIDGRSRALRRGRHIALSRITEGAPVRASFDLVGGGESLARDIVLRR